MSFNPGEKYKELGKVTQIKQKQRKWPSLEKSKIESLLITKRHELVTTRNLLVLRKTFLEAQMLRLSKLAQKKKIQRAVEQYFDGVIAEHNRLGLPAQRFEKQRKQSDKIALRILNAPKAIESRKDQKIKLGGAAATAVLTAYSASNAVAEASHGKSVGTAFGVAGSGAIAVFTGGFALASLKDYWERRGGIKAMSKEYKKQIQQIDERLKRIKK
jgi:hypothetical protein